MAYIYKIHARSAGDDWYHHLHAANDCRDIVIEKSPFTTTSSSSDADATRDTRESTKNFNKFQYV